MAPLTISFTPDAAELDRIRALISKATDVRSRRIYVALSVLFIVEGLLNVFTSGPGHWFGWVQILCGIVYAPLALITQKGHLLQARPATRIDLTIDDDGITLAQPPTRIPWKKIVAIRDVGEAFVAIQKYGKSVPILKRALPDGGSELWSALDAKLTASRYLVRGTDSRLTISNSAVRN